MEGDDNTNIASKRTRDDDINDDVPMHVEALNLYDRATKIHREYREAQARWDIYKDTLKESGSRYILRVQMAIMKETDPSLGNVFDDICEIDRLIGPEAGFYIAFRGKKRLMYGYASSQWTCEVEDAKASIRFSIFGGITLKHPYMFGGLDDVALTMFVTLVRAHFDSLRTLANRIMEENRILLRDPMHYWTTTLIHAIRENFDPISQTYNGREN